MDEDDSENVEEPTENEENLQAWCILEESENEQWQEVISRRNKQRVKKNNQASLLSVESSHSLSPKKIVEVKDKCVKVRDTMDSGAAGHVMPETMLPRVKLERKTSRRSLWQSKTWVRETFHSRQTRELRGAQHSEVRMMSTPLFRCKRSSEFETIIVLDEKNPHTRKVRDGTVIKLDVNNGVYTMDMWICLDETGRVLSWQGQ